MPLILTHRIKLPAALKKLATRAPGVDGAAWSALIEAATAARLQAHAPYSKFLVGAAVLDEQGRIHAGCNVENAAYPQGVCAEGGALSAMVLAGGRRLGAVVVLGAGDGLVTPCGGCRQKLREFAGPDTPILIADPLHARALFTMDELLPHSFGPDHLSPAP